LVKKRNQSIGPSFFCYHKLKIYPNPTNGEVVVKADFQMESICVLTSDGRVIYTLNEVNQTSFTLDFSGLTAGIYFLQTTNGKEIAIKKVIVE
jgi:hypothetical protein